MCLKSLFFNIERVFEVTGFNLFDDVCHGFKVYPKTIAFIQKFIQKLWINKQISLLLEILLEIMLIEF